MSGVASGGANGLGGGVWGSTSQDMSEAYKLLDDTHDATVSVRKLQHVFKTLEPDLSPKDVRTRRRRVASQRCHCCCCH